MVLFFVWLPKPFPVSCPGLRCAARRAEGAGGEKRKEEKQALGFGQTEKCVRAGSGVWGLGSGRMSRIGQIERMGKGMVLEGAGITALGDSMTCHRVPKRRLVAALQNRGRRTRVGSSPRGCAWREHGAGRWPLAVYGGVIPGAMAPGWYEAAPLALGKIAGRDWVTRPPGPQR